MTQPTLDACSRFPTDFPQEEELPEQTQQAQATTAGPYSLLGVYLLIGSLSK